MLEAIGARIPALVRLVGIDAPQGGRVHPGRGGRRRWPLVALLSLVALGGAWQLVQGVAAPYVAERVRVALRERLDVRLEADERVQLCSSGALELTQATLRHPKGKLVAARLIVTPDLVAWLRGEGAAGAVRLEGVELSSHGLPTLRLPAVTARLRQEGAEQRAEVTLELPAGGRVVAALSRAGASVLLTATIEALTTDDLPAEVRGRLPFEPSGRLHGLLTARLDEESAHAEGSLTLPDLTLRGERVAPTPVGPLPLSLTFTADYDRAEQHLTLGSTRLIYGPTREAALELGGVIDLSADGELWLEAKLVAEDTRALVAALPEAARPPAAAPALLGALYGIGHVTGPARRPLEWVVEGKLDLSALRAAARATPQALADSFVYRTRGADGIERAIPVGDDNPDFVSLAELPAFVADAVVTAEDGGFYTHQGFDFDEVKNSLLAVYESGRPVRGGSTISQQLAKNLFLTREKTLVRKAREALTTLALEASLKKERLLEIYLNVIEWGPSVYGVAQAARTYFDKDPRELLLKEAVYLASIIPNPHRYYVYFERGAPSDTWQARMAHILDNMSEHGRVGVVEHARAIEAPLVFRHD